MASPLTLVLQVKPGQLIPLFTALAQSGTSIDQALASLGTVHYARTAILDVSKLAALGWRGIPGLAPSLMLACIRAHATSACALSVSSAASASRSTSCGSS